MVFSDLGRILIVGSLVGLIGDAFLPGVFYLAVWVWLGLGVLGLGLVISGRRQTEPRKPVKGERSTDGGSSAL